MNEREEQDEVLIDMGSAVVATKGAVVGDLDFIGLPQNQTGIADD